MSSSVTVVTGAAGALGWALAQHLLAKGERVALLDQPEQQAQLAAREAEFSGRCLGIGLDVSSGAAWEQGIARVTSGLGPITGAALIAGGFAGGQAFHEAPAGVWSQMMARNLETAQSSLRASVGELVKLGRGSVVVVGARPAVRPWEGKQMAAYTASKAAVVALAQAVASEVLDHGVRVNAVMPSALDTPANRASMPNADFSRWVSLESVAGVIAFLLSDAARDISGAAVPVYGRA